MNFEVINGADVPEQRGRKAGVRNGDAAHNDAAIARAVEHIAAGMPVRDAAETVKIEYRLNVETDYIVRRIHRLQKA